MDYLINPLTFTRPQPSKPKGVVFRCRFPPISHYFQRFFFIFCLHKTFLLPKNSQKPSPLDLLHGQDKSGLQQKWLSKANSSAAQSRQRNLLLEAKRRTSTVGMLWWRQNSQEICINIYTHTHASGYFKFSRKINTLKKETKPRNAQLGWLLFSQPSPLTPFLLKSPL